MNAARICVIFNPAAKGDQAITFRRHLNAFAGDCALKLTAAAGDARRLAAEAVREGFETVVAVGGDGTVNEVLNGLGDAPQGFDQARLAVLPLGTVNVFARELKLPFRLERAWRVILAGRESRIDLPWVEFGPPEARVRRYFAQLAGAGLDARAVELVSLPLKRKIGRLAYVVAGCQALFGAPARITAAGGTHSQDGALVLIGNGRLYGGPYRLFPQADLRDGLLDVCVLPRADWLTLAWGGPPLVLARRLPAACTRLFRAETVTLTSPGPTPFELDGELVGHLPATFSVKRAGLRVVVP